MDNMSANSTNPIPPSNNDFDQEDNDSFDTEGAIAHNGSALGLTFDQPQLGDGFETVYDRLRKNILAHSGREDEDSLLIDEQDLQGNRGEMMVEGSCGTLLNDLEQLRKWKKRSERDCEHLRKENQRLNEEIAMLRKQSNERYKAMLGEKAELAEKTYVSD